MTYPGDSAGRVGPKATFLGTLAFSHVHETFVYVNSTIAPSPDDWTTYCAFIRKRTEGHVHARSLVYSEGAGPSTLQRKELHEATQGLKSTVAVITESAMARGIVTLLSWMTTGYKAFPPEQIENALRFLVLDGREAREVEAEMRYLRRYLGRQPQTARHGP